MKSAFLMFVAGLFGVGAEAIGNPASLTFQTNHVAAPASDAGTEAGKVDCGAGAGKRLCRHLKRFESLLIECSGQGCYYLWKQQIATIQDLTDYYYDEIDLEAEVSQSLGTQATEMAKNLCAVRVTGDATYITALAVHYNQLLDVLEELQENSGIKAPYTCTFNLD